MSKIFDALKKTEGEVASIALPSIDTAGSLDAAPEKDEDIELAWQSFYSSRPVKTDVKHLGGEQISLERLGRVIAYTNPVSLGADRFRLLQMRLRELWTAVKLRSLLVTSPLPGDGKTTIALNLATVLAEERERNVVLVDADLHRGCLDDQLGLTRNLGMKECLRDGLNPISAIRRVEPLGWYLLSAGIIDVGTPTELLQPQQISYLIQKLTFEFDWIIIDCPPVLVLSDAVSLTPHVDGSLLVARAGRTPVKAVEDSIARLGRKHVKGVVLNGIEKLDQPSSAYYKHETRVRQSPELQP